MKNINYATIFITIFFNSSLINTSDQLPTRTIDQTRSEFNKKCKTFTKIKDEKKLARIATGLGILLTGLYSHAIITDENTNMINIGFLGYFFILTYFNCLQYSKKTKCLQSFVEKCSQEFSSKELEVLQTNFYQLNPSTPLDKNSLLFSVQRQQWLLENKPK